MRSLPRGRAGRAPLPAHGPFVLPFLPVGFSHHPRCSLRRSLAVRGTRFLQSRLLSQPGGGSLPDVPGTDWAPWPPRVSAGNPPAVCSSSFISPGKTPLTRRCLEDFPVRALVLVTPPFPRSSPRPLSSTCHHPRPRAPPVPAGTCSLTSGVRAQPPVRGLRARGESIRRGAACGESRDWPANSEPRPPRSGRRDTSGRSEDRQTDGDC